MMRKMTLIGVMAGLLVATAACGPPTADKWDESFQVGQPMQAGDRVMYLNRTLEQVQVLEPTRSGETVDLNVERVPTGEDPTQTAMGPNEEYLFVMNAADETLGVYDLTADTLEMQTVELDSAYDRITVDPAGDFVLLGFTGGSNSDCVACNLNEIGIVDLRDGVPDQAEFVTLPKRAQDLVFAPSFTMDGSTQRLAAALSPSQISIVDLKALADGDKTNGVREVPLTSSQADQIKQPEQAVFDVQADEETDRLSLYLLTSGGNDVTQVAIKASTRMDAERKFDLSVNQLAAGNSPTAMTVLDLPDAGKRLLTLDASSQKFHLVDVQSGEGSSFDLPITAPADDLLVYETVVSTSEGDKPETRVLAWSNRSALVAVIRPASIAISNDNPTVGRSVEAIRLQTTPQTIRMDQSAEQERAIAIHGGSNSGFSVLNLAGNENDAISIQGSSLQDLTFAGTVAYGLFKGKPNFGRFDLENGHPTNYELPSPGESLFRDADEELIIVDHGTATGEFTVVDANEPGPENGRVFQGVFIENLLQQDFGGDQ